MFELVAATNRHQWETIFAAAGKSPLLQSWAYGEVKRAEGWIPRRFLVQRAGKIVAVAQILEKRLFGLVRVGRLNRGPVWVENISDSEMISVLRLLAKKWKWWTAAALFIAPEVSNDMTPLLRRSGFIPRRHPCWVSSWINLSLPSETLRKGLDGKWRNMLVGSEKNGLLAELSRDNLARAWLMQRYAELMRDKSFTGMPPAQINALAQVLNRPEDLLTIRALSPDGEAVGGILLARHGASATYLVGWNGDVGRKMKANNFLLWQAILALQAQGCRWFDLGGIDDQLTPGIAAFKRGMKGQEYRLAGEFLSL